MTMMTSPYTLGAGMVQTVAADRRRPRSTHSSATCRRTSPRSSTRSRRCQRRRPPRSTYPDGGRGEEVRLRRVRSPGVVSLLSERLPLQDALTTVDGWGGDHVGFERKGNTAHALRTRATPTGHEADAVRAAPLGCSCTGPADEVEPRPATWCASRPVIPARPPRWARTRRRMRSTSSPPGPPSASASLRARRTGEVRHAAWPGSWCGTFPVSVTASTRSSRPATRPSRHGFNSSPPAAARRPAPAELKLTLSSRALMRARAARPCRC